MAYKLSERQQAVALSLVLIVAVAGLYAATLALQPAPVQTYVVHAVHLDVESPSWSIRYDPIATANNTAFSLLQEAAHRLGFGVSYVPYEIPDGVLVTSINGTANGESGRYWQYWVNGVYASVASDHQALRDGDVVLWNFTSSVEGM